MRKTKFMSQNISFHEEKMCILDYQFIDQLKQLHYIDEIWLFGSRARGDHAEKSDIDIAIVCSAEDKEWSHIMDIIEQADTLLKIDCVRFDRHQISQNLYDHILRDRKAIYVKKQNKA